MSSVLEQSQTEAPSSPEGRSYLFSVDDFYRMIDLDIFPDEARVGLWEGRVYEEMAKKHAHSFSWGQAEPRGFDAHPTAGLVRSGRNARSPSARTKAPLPDMLILERRPRRLQRPSPRGR